MLNLQDKYTQYQRDNLLRELTLFIKDDSIIDFTTSDYLNLSSAHNLKHAIVNGFDKYGFGSKGSNIVCGYTDETQQFEHEFAKFINYPRAIFFSSGFMANLAIYSTLFSKHDSILADKYIHASIIDGIKLSQAKLRRYKHQQLSQLQDIYDGKSFITTEGVFSTSGSITQLDKLAKITPEKLIVDEAHSFGVLGKNGRGAINSFRISYKNCPICVFPLGKAFGGVGAVVCTTEAIAEYLIQFARNYIYTTALPPMILKAALIQLKNLENANDNRVRLQQNITFFNELCDAKDLELVSKDLSPIRSIQLNNANLAIRLKDKLFENKIIVSCFRYPTVPKDQAILRFSLHSNNTFDQIQQALEIISKEVKYEYIRSN
ncbi:aminotransferase class I/II-fold pyridoxal phosphate-dependent enzyme [Francisella tularensis]|uniref:aminotransferase class I/II-fold pyridoxal phosphate-dependent enzyme n=1 Tax=Francisella tularensis TaxID=263 RepID=UPI00163A4FF2|nr:pyridoxal phosphate-dependent aminotransferase family protein [Francisella tularensis]MBC2799068.1 pyridoxal phosphate-dependent aminotransferase family protein [Francisella tularensis subsp. holarctica]